MRASACFASSLIVATVAVATGASRQAPAIEGRCGPAREALLHEWGVVPPARPQPSATDGTRVVHWPTATPGVWVVEQDAPDASLVRVSPLTVTRVRWSDSCAAVRESRPRQRAAPPRFDDADLQAVVRAGRGVIFSWSPHMPLSVDAVAPLKEAADRHGLSVTLVLDPAADRAFAARIAAERGLPAGALRVADSVELQFRDVLVHAPAVQAYAGGRLVGSAYPGGHTADEYDLYFRRVLADGP